MRNIQTIITDDKRGKQIDHPRTTFTLDSDKQKKPLRKTQKTKTTSYNRHDAGTKQNSKTQILERKTYSKNKQYKYNIRC